MKYLTTIRILWQFGLPVAKELTKVLQDGKVTRDEIYRVINAIMGDRTEVVFWKTKKV